jgi:uncharacterized RDD family membrane protein YckC
MNEPRTEGSPYPKADLTLRALARLVDFILAVALALCAPPWGPMAAAVYLLVADALMSGQSLGKRLFGIRVVSIPRRVSGGLQESVLRNAPFALVAVFGSVTWLWPVLFVAGVPIVAYETWRIVTDKLGVRIGDVFADTQVVDGKVLARPEATVQPLGTATTARPSSSASASRA